MRNELNRENCLSQYLIDGAKQFDISDNGLTDFNFGNYGWTIVKFNEAHRPDLVAQRVYGTQDLWWFVMWLNGLSDAWNDLEADTAIKYVNKERIKDAIRYVKKRVFRLE